MKLKLYHEQLIWDHAPDILIERARSMSPQEVWESAESSFTLLWLLTLHKHGAAQDFKWEYVLMMLCDLVDTIIPDSPKRPDMSSVAAMATEPRICEAADNILVDHRRIVQAVRSLAFGDYPRDYRAIVVRLKNIEAAMGPWNDTTPLTWLPTYELIRTARYSGLDSRIEDETDHWAAWLAAVECANAVGENNTTVAFMREWLEERGWT